jgi:hypothetical protein
MFVNSCRRIVMQKICELLNCCLTTLRLHIVFCCRKAVLQNLTRWITKSTCCPTVLEHLWCKIYMLSYCSRTYVVCDEKSTCLTLAEQLWCVLRAGSGTGQDEGRAEIKLSLYTRIYTSSKSLTKMVNPPSNSRSKMHCLANSNKGRDEAQPIRIDEIYCR